MVRLISRGLGLFSAALGMAQLFAPRRLLNAVGIRPSGWRVAITRLVGVRELSVVPGLLGASRPWGWLAARVAGDVMDLGLMAAAIRSRSTLRGPLTAALAVVAAITTLDIAAAVAARRENERRSRHPGRIVRVVTVNRPVEELYRFWSNLENLPRVMPHLESVTVRGGGLSHWVARGPLGQLVEWDAETVDDRPEELIGWRSVEGAQVQTSGTVRFARAPGGRGTEVTVEMEYTPPGGVIGVVVAALSGEEPRQQVPDALRRFKQVMETGEPIVSEATVEGRRLRRRPAQPPEGAAPTERVPVVMSSAEVLS